MPAWAAVLLALGVILLMTGVELEARATARNRAVGPTRSGDTPDEIDTAG